jgi:tetratricopeptide (TPR) repeat protein
VSGRLVRINIQVIDSRSEEQIWAESYDREYSDIFAIQSDIAQNITSVLRAALTVEEKDFLDRIPTESMEAYEFYQKGNYYWYNFATRETNLKAAEMYEKAIALDPNFAIAYAKLAYVSISLYQEWDDPTTDRLEKARLALDRATALAPDLPEVHLTKGYYLEGIQKDYNLAYKELETALKYQPNNTNILDDLGIFFLREGKPERAADYFIRSFKLNPYGLWSGLWVSNCYLRMRSWAEALKWTNIYTSNHPDIPNGYGRKCEILLFGTGNIEKASEVIEEGMRHTNSKFVLQRVIIELYGRKYEEALKVLVSDSSAYDNLYLMNYNLQKAEIYRILGDMISAEQNYRLAKILYESLIKEQPNRDELYSNLGLTLAGLGNKNTAIQMGLKAVELLPVKSDYFLRAEQMILNLSYIYIMTGDYDKAITQIEFLLSIPSHLTIWRLKLDPLFDPLRNETKFKELLIENSEDNYAR